jgi:hypothetical protein
MNKNCERNGSVRRRRGAFQVRAARLNDWPEAIGGNHFRLDSLEITTEMLPRCQVRSPQQLRKGKASPSRLHNAVRPAISATRSNRRFRAYGSWCLIKTVRAIPRTFPIVRRFPLAPCQQHRAVICGFARPPRYPRECAPNSNTNSRIRAWHESSVMVSGGAGSYDSDANMLLHARCKRRRGKRYP